MRAHTLQTTITIGSSEVPATVEFDFYRGYIARAPRGEAFPLEPDEEPSVEITQITLHHPKDSRRDVTLVEGLLFDACADDWLRDKCFEYVGEDADA
jgi:hypothetical protein